MNREELPAPIQYLIKQMNDKSVNKTLRQNYALRLRDINNVLDDELKKFEKSA